jgi:hypothetical protein
MAPDPAALLPPVSRPNMFGLLSSDDVRRRPIAARHQPVALQAVWPVVISRRRVSLRLLLQTTFPASPGIANDFLARTRLVENKAENALTANPGSEKRLAIRGLWVCSRDLPPPAPKGTGETLTKQKLLLRILLNSRQVSSLGCMQRRRFCQKFGGIGSPAGCWRRMGSDRRRLLRQGFGTATVKLRYPYNPQNCCNRIIPSADLPPYG